MLTVDTEADDERIRAAYLAKLKQFPPDRCPAEFEQVRDALQLPEPALRPNPYLRCLALRAACLDAQTMARFLGQRDLPLGSHRGFNGSGPTTAL